MECRFFVGQRVVCVDASWSGVGKPPELVEGQHYTIRRIGVGTIYDAKYGEPVIFLKEIVRTHHIGPYEPGLYHKRFRPATDISSLESLLRTTKLPQDERTPEHA
jgi:hypothetical protein